MVSIFLACVASVSVWFRSKERPRNGILGFGSARNETRTSPRSFTYAIFRAIFDSCSSFFAPKPHENARYAGYYFPSCLFHAIQNIERSLGIYMYMHNLENACNKLSAITMLGTHSRKRPPVVRFSTTKSSHFNYGRFDCMPDSFSRR